MVWRIEQNRTRWCVRKPYTYYLHFKEISEKRKGKGTGGKSKEVPEEMKDTTIPN